MEYLGYGMLALLFIVLFILIGQDIGYIESVCVYLITAGIASWIGLAVYLINP